ncbi:MAG: metallophosphoesterase family protein [Anaerolineae bacterium]|nr:hypothetical protein [Chloroflexota bacterium]
MSRIILLSDTHYGGDAQGYRLQPSYIERLPELLAALTEWIHARSGVDLILHAGDCVEQSSPELVTEAVAQLRELSAPLLVAPGNHDMTSESAQAVWRARAADLMPVDRVASVVLPDCAVHALPVHWGERPWYWDGGAPRPRLRPEDLATLQQRLKRGTDRPHLVLCHAAPQGQPAAQTGRDTDGDAPPAEYSEAWRCLGEGHAHLRLLLCGHSHINALGTLGPIHWLTASSFVESPFEFKELQVTDAGLEVRTHTLFPRVPWRPDYWWDAAYVQGRPRDRSLTLRW